MSSAVKSHFFRVVCGVGPAERTGKPSTRYWPGRIRTSPSASPRRHQKPREMNPPLTNVPPTVVLRQDYIHSGTLPKAESILEPPAELLNAVSVQPEETYIAVLRYSNLYSVICPWPRGEGLPGEIDWTGS